MSTPSEQTPSPASEATVQKVQDATIGSMIGPYKILQSIGEGGFGTVYLAEQRHPVSRRVALKIIKPGMDTKQVIARFEAERQALAVMDHPHIAKVFDAGATESGRPYFVMELVRGVPITEYCDTECLSTRQRLELFIDVCRAVQHAHQKGIIHRDLKPTNVMVTIADSKAIPKVIDFGIAKATGRRLTDKTIVTEYHQLMGTPHYMSPEQAEMSGLDIDTRSDIYSLGVMLYELLSGTRPFEFESLHEQSLPEMQRIIREVDPHKPSSRLLELSKTGGGGILPAKQDGDATSSSSIQSIARHRKSDPARLRRELKGDLDWIVMKCLAKDRSRRYETANGIALDLERHLRNEPVTAGPPGMGYQLRKFARRHRALVSGVAAMMLVLLLGIVGTTTQWMQARRQATKAEVINEFLTGIITAPDPLWVLSEPDPTRRSGPNLTIAEATFDVLPLIDETFKGYPDAEADTRLAIGRSFVGLSHFAEARKQLTRALTLYIDLYGEEDARTRDCQRVLGFALEMLGEPLEAERLMRQALDNCRRLLGEEHPETILTKIDLAQLLMDKYDRILEAEALCREVLESPGAAARAGSWIELQARGELAFVLQMQFKAAQAEQLGRATLEALISRGAGESGLAIFLRVVLGNCAMDMGDPVRAEMYFGETLALSREFVGEEGFMTATVRQLLTMPLIAQGRWIEGEVEAKLAYESHRKTMGEQQEYTKASHIRIIICQLGQRPDDQDLWRQLRILIDSGIEHLTHESLFACNSLTRYLIDLDRLDDARNLLDWGSGFQAQVLAFPRPEPYVSMALRARMECLSGRHEQGVTLLREAETQAAKRLPEWNFSQAAQQALSDCEMKLDQFDSAAH
ncbi:MAG: serine/threonine protein kinase [Planctomycetes bacterium]|nr:serine/threonine protein kinase [Planctomycetota bacterium]